MDNIIPCPGCKSDIPLNDQGLPTVPVSIRKRHDGTHLVFCSSMCEATDWTARKIDLNRMVRNHLGEPAWMSLDCKPPMAKAGVRNDG